MKIDPELILRRARGELPPGPWDQEDNRVDFKHAGTACFIKRNHLGVWCGYVSVAKTHPAYGLDYDAINEKFAFDVHGGLTYTEKCQGELCHVPEPGDPSDVWWLGFDCGHTFDLTPSMDFLGLPMSEYNVYRDQKYVTEETKKLAEQVRGLL